MISVRRRLLFNTGKYESVEIEAIVSDLPDDTEPDSISTMLDEVMAPEIERVEKATSKTEDDTMLYTWIDITRIKEGC
jgi:hypothetical protein